MARAAAIVLSFHNILLHQSDVDLLDEPHWLNDTIISFYFEYLEKNIFRNAKELLFVSPEVTQCIKMVHQDEINTFLEPLGISKKLFVFFPLNDNDVDMAGGSHWSLLVYSKPESCFYHFDSSHVSNYKAAFDFASHLMSYLSDVGKINYINKDCLQQGNGYDCGIHVLCNAERLAECAHHTGNIGDCDMHFKISPSSKRKEIAKLIKNLAHSE